MNDGVNRDTTIEVGDLVRVVNPRQSMPYYTSRDDFIVVEIDTKGMIFSELDGYFPDELEIMKPKAELKSVYAEEERLQADYKKCYDILKTWYEKRYLEPEELTATLKEIFDK